MKFISEIKVLIFINVIQLKQLILESNIGKRLIEAGEATPQTAYEFQDSFPDNIVLPINPKQPGIISFDKINNINQLTPSLRNFINTLNAAIKSNKLVKGEIKITSEAASATNATNVVPGGSIGDWNQAQVDFSYSNGAKMNNQTLADRRAEGIEYVIKKFVKLPATVTITKLGNGNGSKKSARAVVPIQTFNKNSPATTFTKDGKKETFDLNATKYTPPSFTDPKIEVVDCGKSLDANGIAGNPIAYRSKLSVKSGTLTLNFNPAYIPDRLVILKMAKGQGTPAPIFDSGYMSYDPAGALVDFGKTLDELNKTVKNGYDGNIKQVTPVSIDLGEDDGSIFYLEVYAPLGPTVWSMSVACSVKGTSPDVASSTLEINISNISAPEITPILNKPNSKVKISSKQGNVIFAPSDGNDAEYIIAAPDSKTNNPTGAEITQFIRALTNNGKPYTNADPTKLVVAGKLDDAYVKQILGTNFNTVLTFNSSKTLSNGTKFSGYWYLNISNRWFSVTFTQGVASGIQEITGNGLRNLKQLYGVK
jgi:hypothetical protein